MLAMFTLALLAKEKVTVIVTALNVLGKQNEEQLSAAGIPAISIDAGTATEANFRVSIPVSVLYMLKFMLPVGY